MSGQVKHDADFTYINAKKLTSGEMGTAITVAHTLAPQDTGKTFLVSQASGVYSITLPTATTAAEGTELQGWNCTLIVNATAANTLTVVRGDTSNDEIVGMVSGQPQDASIAAMEITANTCTFVASTAAIGDRMEITCYSADATNTKYMIQGFCTT